MLPCPDKMPVTRAHFILLLSTLSLIAADYHPEGSPNWPDPTPPLNVGPPCCGQDLPSPVNQRDPLSQQQRLEQHLLAQQAQDAQADARMETWAYQDKLLTPNQAKQIAGIAAETVPSPSPSPQG